MQFSFGAQCARAQSERDGGELSTKQADARLLARAFSG